MNELLKILYSEDKVLITKKLYEESDDNKERLLIRSVIASALKDKADIISDNGSDWILCTLCQFGKNEEDTMRVFQSIMRYINKDIDIGLLDKNVKRYKLMSELADSCLVGIGLFSEHVKKKVSIDYYSKVGSLAFRRLQFDNIANEFNEWTNFLNKELTI